MPRVRNRQLRPKGNDAWPAPAANPSPPAQIVGHVSGWNKVGVRLLDSGLPKINGVRPPDRSPSTNFDTPEPSFTGDAFITAVGYSTLAQITIEEDLPIKMTVVGIFGELNQSNL